MRQFKTESKKLLDLMINSIYTNREIFLRELVSNASDAVDKLHFASLTDSAYKLDDELQIRLTVDKDARTLTISDNGIGMSAEELDSNLGTIAHSGSEEFKAANTKVTAEKTTSEVADEVADKKDVDADITEADGAEAATPSAAEIIGQFGVGFYSAFMVAKHVRVISRAFGSEVANVWESDGLDGYTVSPADADALLEQRSFGTDVILTLRDDTDDENYSDYLEQWQLSELVKRYSNYVRYPVRMFMTKSRQKPAPDPKPEDYTPEWEEYSELETLNSMTPIWRRKASEVTQDEYDEFYEQSFHDYAKPLRTFSLHAEGMLEYDALLFIPSKQPFDLYSRDYEKGLQLYSRGVLIQDKSADLLPDYYNFVHGVVDSPDIALNISRETLQQTRQVQAIAKRVERKITTELKDMRDNAREDYEKFFENFGRGIKYGIYASYGEKKDPLADLLLYWSAKQGAWVTLAEYVSAMPEGQDVIYYAAGEDRARLEKMPVVHSVLDRGFDVLLMTEDVDEFSLQMLHSYTAQTAPAEGEETQEKSYEFKNVSSGDLDLASDEEKKQAEETADENKELLEAMKEALGDAVSKVAVSPLATEAPAVIAAEGPISLEMERVMSAGPEGMPQIGAQRVLQLNASHPVFEKLQAAQKAGDSEKIALMSSLLLDQALLMAGLPVQDPLRFAQNIAQLMV